MEDLFEVLVFVVIAIIAGVSKSNKNKKKAADKPKSAQPTRPAQPVEPARPAPKALTKQNLESAFAAFTELLEDNLPNPDKPAPTPPVKAREQTSIEAETASKKRAQLIQTRIQESLSGKSAVDEHGCIGGSMPEHTAEGETLAEHAQHEHNRTERLKAETAAIRAESLRKPELTELRKAVIMAEILDKPVSLRRRRI